MIIKQTPNYTPGNGKFKACHKCQNLLTLDKFYVSKRDGVLSVCKECTATLGKEYRKRKPENAMSRKKRWRANPANKEKENAKWREYYYKNREHLKKKAKEYAKLNKEVKKIKRQEYMETDEYLSSYYKRKYNVSLEEVLELRTAQESRCAICYRHEEEVGKRLFLDHNHLTGKVRGLLCNHCNSLIGYAKEDADILESAIYYVHKHAV